MLHFLTNTSRREKRISANIFSVPAMCLAIYAFQESLYDRLIFIEV